MSSSLSAAAIASIVSAVAVVGGTAYSVDQSRKAANLQEDQRRVQNRIEDRKNQKALIDNIRQSRVAAAQVANVGAVGGFGSSNSGTAGSVASIGSQTAANVNYMQQNQADINTALSLSSQIGNAQSAANVGALVSSVGTTGLSTLGQMGKLKFS